MHDIENGEAVEYLLIAASENFSGPGEFVDVLAELREMLDKEGLLDIDGLVRFATPEQIRAEWTPAETVFDSADVQCARFDSGVYTSVAEVSGFEEMKQYLVSLGVEEAAGFDRSTLWGERVTPYDELLDLLELKPEYYIQNWESYTRVTDEIIVRHTGIPDEESSYIIYERSRELTEAVEARHSCAVCATCLPRST